MKKKGKRAEVETNIMKTKCIYICIQYLMDTQAGRNIQSYNDRFIGNSYASIVNKQNHISAFAL